MLSAEGKRVSLHTRNQKLDAECPVLNLALLTNQLVQTVLRHGAKAVRVDIYSMISSRSFAVYRHAEAHRLPTFRRPQNQVQVARIEAIEDAARCSQRRSDLTLILPVALKRPLVLFQFGRSLIGLRGVVLEPARRSEVFRALKPHISLGR